MENTLHYIFIVDRKKKGRMNDHNVRKLLLQNWSRKQFVAANMQPNNLLNKKKHSIDNWKWKYNFNEKYELQQSILLEARKIDHWGGWLNSCTSAQPLNIKKMKEKTGKISIDLYSWSLSAIWIR